MSFRIEYCGRYGDIESVEWLLKNRYLGLLRDKLIHAPRTLSSPNIAAIKRACADTTLGVDLFRLLYAQFKYCFEDEYWALDTAAAAGNVPVVWLLHAARTPYTNHAIEAAATAGHLEVLQILMDDATPTATTTMPSNHAMDRAAAAGHLAVVAFLQTRRVDATVAAIDGAVRYGHMHVVDYLLRNRSEGYSFEAMKWAAAMGSIDTLKFLLERRRKKMYCRGRRKELLAVDGVNLAAGGGHLATLQYLASETKYLRVMHRSAIDYAAESGRLNVVKWLLGQFEVSDVSSAFEYACMNGHLEVVRQLHASSRVTLTESTAPIDLAAAGGHLEVVQWLHAYRTEPATVYAKDSAACGGHLDVLKFLVESRPNESCTCSALDQAASHGHLDVLIYLWERQPPCSTVARITSSASDFAALEGHLDILKYIYTTIPEARASDKALSHAAERGHLEVVRFLLDIGISVTSRALDAASKHGHLEVLRVLIAESQGTVQPGDAMDLACVAGFLDVAIELHSHFPRAKCTMLAYVGAAEADHVSIVEFLLGSRPDVQVHGEALPHACANGSTRMFQLLHPRNKTMPFNWYFGAVRTGNLQVLLDLGIPLVPPHQNQPNPMELAALHGNLNLFKWLHTKGLVHPDINVVWNACKGGHLTFLNYILSVESLVFSRSIMIEACKNGNLSMVKLLLKQYPTPIKSLKNLAQFLPQINETIIQLFK
eukprot:gene2900-3330_t